MLAHKHTPPRDHATELLRAFVRDAALKPHEKLPSERDLAERWGLNRVTLRGAIGRLASSGELYVRHGAGAFVGAPQIDFELKRTAGFSDSVRAAGRVPGARVLEQRVEGEDAGDDASAGGVVADGTVADGGAAPDDGVPDGAGTFVLRRVRTVDGAPIAIEETRLDVARFPGIGAQDFSDRSLYDWLERSCGIVAAHEDARISLTRVGEDDALHLGVDAGAPAFLRCGVVRDEEGAPIESYRTVMLPRGMAYVSNLYRREVAQAGEPAGESAPGAPGTMGLAPKYIQLREAVRASIQTGEYPVGRPIPTDVELAERYGVNRLTARSGIDGLVEEGLLERVRGKGVYVRLPRARANLDEIGGFRLNEHPESGRRVTRRVLGRFLRDAGPLYAQVFGVQQDDVLVYTRSLSQAGDGLSVLEETFVPQAVAPGFGDYDAALFDADEILAYCGVSVTSAREELTVRSLEQGDARVLGAQAGDSALCLVCVERDGGDRVVEVSVTLTVGEVGEFSTRY